MNVWILTITLMITNVVWVMTTRCRFVSKEKCLGDPRNLTDIGFPNRDADNITSVWKNDFESCSNLCDLTISCLMAAFNTENNECTLFKKISYYGTMSSKINIYKWMCCNNNTHDPATNRCPGFWTEFLGAKSDNQDRTSEPLTEFKSIKQFECMIQCLLNPICGAINVIKYNVEKYNFTTCQLIIQFPVENIDIHNNTDMITYHWTCAFNYTDPEPARECIKRKDHIPGYWIVQNRSMSIDNNTDHLLDFYTFDYNQCLDNCKMYKYCMRAWFSPKNYYCVLEADAREECRDPTEGSSYYFTTYIWQECSTNPYSRDKHLNPLSGDCATLENNDGVYIHSIKCGFTAADIADLYPCRQNNKEIDKTKFYHWLHCEQNQSFRVLETMKVPLFNVTWQRVFTGYESFWLVNVSNSKFRKAPNDVCNVFDSSMDVSDVKPLKLINRTQWFATKHFHSERPFPTHPVTNVIISDTERPFCNCFTIEACSYVMRRIQAVMHGLGDSMGFNFIVTGDGVVYEALGWDLEPQIAGTEYNSDSFAIGLCGRYKHTPNAIALSSVKQLIGIAVKRGKVSRDYKLYMYNDLRERAYPYAGLRIVIQLWPHYRGHINPDCRPITNICLILNIVAFIIIGFFIMFSYHKFVYKICHKQQCYATRKCRIDNIYSNGFQTSVEILPKIVIQNFNNLMFDEKYLSPFLSPVYWIEDSPMLLKDQLELRKCSCCTAIFAVFDLYRIQNKLVNIGSLTLLSEVQCCSRIIAFIFQRREELGTECLIIAHFKNKRLFYRYINNLHQNNCICDNNIVICYKHSMRYVVMDYKNLRISTFQYCINTRHDFQKKFTYVIETNDIIRDYDL